MLAFIDIQNLILVISLSLIISIISVQFSIKDIFRSLPFAFLLAGIVVGFADFIIFLQNLKAEDIISKSFGVILLAPFYGLVLAIISYLFKMNTHRVRVKVETES